MMQTIAGQHAFITGGASGIGLAIAQALQAEGAVVTIADYDVGRLERLPSEFQCLILDVRDRANWAEAKRVAQDTCGPVSILVNNAGIGPSQIDLADTDPAVFDRMIAIKLTGTFNGIHAFAADMRGRGHGHIVNTASMAAFEPREKLAPYTAAKCGVVGLSEVLRLELAPHGVGVSVLCPGQVATALPSSTAKADGRHAAGAPDLIMPGIDPNRVGLRVVDAIKGNWPYILTHGERRAAAARRMQAVLDAFDATPNSALL